MMTYFKTSKSFSERNVQKGIQPTLIQKTSW